MSSSNIHSLVDTEIVWQCPRSTTFTKSISIQSTKKDTSFAKKCQAKNECKFYNQFAIKTKGHSLAQQNQ